MNDHTCYCAHCDRLCRPMERRGGEGHIGVQFGHTADVGYITVWVNGEKVRDQCIEAYAGGKGWALVDRGPAHRCRSCGVDVCTQRLLGNVTVECLMNEEDDA